MNMKRNVCSLSTPTLLPLHPHRRMDLLILLSIHLYLRASSSMQLPSSASFLLLLMRRTRSSSFDFIYFTFFFLWSAEKKKCDRGSDIRWDMQRDDVTYVWRQPSSFSQISNISSFLFPIPHPSLYSLTLTIIKRPSPINFQRSRCKDDWKSASLKWLQLAIVKLTSVGQVG